MSNRKHFHNRRERGIQISGETADGDVLPPCAYRESDEFPYDFDYDDDDELCETCHGAGYIVICIDDLCANNDHCIHGDGEVICPECKGMSAW